MHFLGKSAYFSARVVFKVACVRYGAQPRRLLDGGQSSFMGYEVLGVPSSKIVSRSISRNVVSEGSRKYVPRRTLMYVPGHDLKKLRKIPILGVDCAVLECEDGVALNKKV